MTNGTEFPGGALEKMVQWELVQKCVCPSNLRCFRLDSLHPALALAVSTAGVVRPCREDSRCPG